MSAHTEPNPPPPADPSGIRAAGKRPLPPGPIIQFDPEGFTYGEQNWRAQIPWECLTGCAMTEIHDNAAVLMRIDSLESARVQPPEATSKALERLSADQAYFGAHIMIMTGLYGLDQPRLAQAMERYATDPAARAELKEGALPAVAG